MQSFLLLSILLSVRTSILVECLPILRRLPVLSDSSFEDDISADEYLDSVLMPPPFPSASEVRAIRQANELVFQDDADLEDVLRDILQDLSRHDDLAVTEKTKELVEMYDYDDGEGMTNSRSLRSYTTKSYSPYLGGLYDIDEEDVKVVSRTSYHWNILEKTLRRMALEPSKVQLAYNIIREKQVNFHPSSSVYKILEKSVSILHTTRRYLDRPPPPIRVAYRPYPVYRGGNRTNDKKYFADKLSRMNGRFKNKLAKLGRKLIRKPVELMYKYL